MGARRWLRQAQAWRREDPSGRDPFALQFAGAIVAVATAVTVVLVVVQLGWDWPFGPTRTTTTTETLDNTGEVVELTTTADDGGGAREAVFRTVAGIAALTAGLLAWGRLEQSRRQHNLDREAADRAVAAQELAVDAQHLATRAQLATERGQVTGRFTTAVTQLGHADPSVRLGALYALEALAHDSPPDRRAITEVVCAYARHHSTRRHPDRTPILGDDADGNPVPEKVDGRAVDHQAAITIALRLPADWDLPTRNLRGTVIADLDLDSLGLPDQRLGAVDFTAATFTGTTSFDGATFTGTTSFGGATFTGHAAFGGATFTADAWFAGATFTGDASFYGATFTGTTTFGGATFTGDAAFGGATFTGHAWFTGARFTGAAQFYGATFTADAWFTGATFTGTAWFAGATFTARAWFTGATVGADGLSLPRGVDPGPEFIADPAEPTTWYRRDGDSASPAATGAEPDHLDPDTAPERVTDDALDDDGRLARRRRLELAVHDDSSTPATGRTEPDDGNLLAGPDDDSPVPS